MSDNPYLQVLGFDVGGTKIAGGIVAYPLESANDGVYTIANEAPRVLAFSTIPTNAHHGADEVTKSLIEFVRSYVDEDRGPLLGIGIAWAGVVNPQTGDITYSNDLMPGFTGRPLKSQVQEQLGIPVSILGDVQGHALGEARWGAARGTHSSICVAVGTGLGGAFVSENNVVLGAHGAAGHVGHTLHPRSANLRCACGRRGHVEALVSGTGLSAYYQGVNFGDILDPGRMGDYIMRQANAGEAAAIEALEMAGSVLGESIGGWCNLFDPEIVVLSGSVCKAGDLWLNSVKKGFSSQVLEALTGIPLVLAELEGYAPLIGAAEHHLDTLLAKGTVIRHAL